MTLITILFLILTIVDQLIKVIITNSLGINESVSIIPAFFNLTNVHNYGAAFSILNNQVCFLVLIGISALILIYFYFIKGKKLKKLDVIFLAMLLAGIVGNILDRIFRGYVIDYLDFTIFGYDYPVFNFADILIVLAMTILVVKTLKEEHHGKVRR